MDGFKFHDVYTFYSESKREELVKEAQEHHVHRRIAGGKNTVRRQEASGQPDSLYLTDLLELTRLEDI